MHASVGGPSLLECGRVETKVLQHSSHRVLLTKESPEELSGFDTARRQVHNKHSGSEKLGHYCSSLHILGIS